MPSIGINTGLRALLSSQFVLNTIGHNIANANRDGFSRQRVELGSSLPVNARGLLIGTGVNASAVRRSFDGLVDRRLSGQLALSGDLEARFAGLAEIEALFNEPGEGSVGTRIGGFFSALAELSTAPDDLVLRTGTTQAASSLSALFRSLSTDIGTLQRDTESEVGALVGEVNQLAQRVATLNVEIGRVEAGGVAANDLRDERDLAIRELARLVDVQSVEGSSGSIRVTVAGNVLVSSARAHPLETTRDSNQDLALRIEGASGLLPRTGGKLGGLFELLEAGAPGVNGELDRLARNMILELNRIHSTGIPVGGPFASLVGESQVSDTDLDGELRDELLSNAGLPFAVRDGTLAVNVTDVATGQVITHALSVSRTHTTVGGFVDALSSIPGLSSDLDSLGRVQVLAAPGLAFDFSTRVDPNPDDAGTFGGGSASLGTLRGPFALSDGDTLDITVDPAGAAVSLSFGFTAADVANVAQATATELADVINADAGAQANGIIATVVGDQLFLQSAGSGQSTSFRIDGGTSLGALGWGALAGSTITGSDNDVDVKTFGAYTGTGTETFTFRANMDGVIGTTAGLTVDVFDSSGARIATLDVGTDYAPETKLTVADGLSVSFGLGELSSTNNDAFDLRLVDDADTSDVLVALGLNTLFTGSDASDIALRADIEADPGLLAISRTGASGDSELLLDLTGVEGAQVEGLNGLSFGRFYGQVVGTLGFEVASVNDSLEINAALVESLELRREQVSGVNIDEELVDLLQYEQSFAAAAQFISIVNQLNDELLSIL